jgi:hypothetical protein
MEPKDFDAGVFKFFIGDNAEPITASAQTIEFVSDSIPTPHLSFSCTIQGTVSDVVGLKGIAKIRRSTMREVRRRFIIAIFMAKRGL